jgi:hypothetical protein
MSLKVIYKEDNNGYLGLSYEPFLQKTIMHIEFKKWNLDECRRYREIWKVIKKCLKEKGMTEIYSLCDSDKEVKFNKFWGFKDTGLMAQTDLGIKIILKLEL